MRSTSIRINMETLEMLKSFSSRSGAKSLDEAILKLIKFYRSRLLDEYFGVDRGRVKGFTEDDRFETREL